MDYEKLAFYAKEDPKALAAVFTSFASRLTLLETAVTGLGVDLSALEGEIDAVDNVVDSLTYPEELGANIALADVPVDNGTLIAAAKELLPATVPYTVDDVEYDLTVTWAADTTPTYNGAVAGTYVLLGTLSNLPACLKNTGAKKAEVDIVVAAGE